jgi:hypothetical protein
VDIRAPESSQGRLTHFASGAAIFSPTIARRMTSYFNQIRNQPAAHSFPELTQREREVMGLMAQHRSNQEIAQSLSLSPRLCATTLRTYSLSSRSPIEPKQLSGQRMLAWGNGCIQGKAAIENQTNSE